MKIAGCKVTCLTLSQEQYQYATDLVRKMGLDTQVTISRLR